MKNSCSNKQTFNKEEYIRCFFESGRSCIRDAKFLLDNHRISSFDILFLNGVEFLFKSFILLNDCSMNVTRLKDEYGHDCLKAFKRCDELNDDPNLFGDNLENQLRLFIDYYSKNIICARYQDSAQVKTLFKDAEGKTIFDFIEERVIAPMDPLVRGISSV